jgi:hypothetical protein
MNVFAIVRLVLEEKGDVTLTAYQHEILSQIIDKLPEIEKHALEDINFSSTIKENSIANRAIKKLRDNETFTIVASLGIMSAADLCDILAALVTGHKDAYGFWMIIGNDDQDEDIENDRTPKFPSEEKLIETILASDIRYGKPHIETTYCTHRVDDMEHRYDKAYFDLLAARGKNLGTPGIVWLNAKCRHVIEEELRVNTVLELLKAYDAYSELDFVGRFGEEINGYISDFFEYWLGENYSKYAE